MPSRDRASVRPPRLADYVPRRPFPTAGGYRLNARPDERARPIVSVVTVVRNGVATLPRTIRSVLSQDRRDIEHIVIDAQSNDGTVELLRSLDREVALWISEPDQGISDAFNKGIGLARGSVVGLLNSDDWYEPKAVRSALEALDTSKADIACGRVQYWAGDFKTYLVASDPSQLARTMTVAHPTVFARMGAYAEWGLFRLDFRLAMDYEWLLRAKTEGARFIAIDQCLANMQGGGVGDRRWRDSQREVARARALHVPGADSPLAYHSYVARSIAKGMVRRGLDFAGLGAVRRWYHRWLSPVRVTASRHSGRR
jgi:glycosyltransferase involved in cell wall biosynthesis